MVIFLLLEFLQYMMDAKKKQLTKVRLIEMKIMQSRI
nr:MAG TPA: apocytochrome F [Caudoviricetes sp.]